MAFMTRWDVSASASWSILGSTVGTTCQDTPYLSLSQPHCWAFASPPSESFS
jgi:hypothetical protein